MSTQSAPQKFKAEYYLLLALPLMGLFPVIANVGVRSFPAIFFAGMSSLVAGVVLLPVALYYFFTARESMSMNAEKWKCVFLNSVLNIALPNMLIFWGTRYTSSINTTILHQTELLTAVIVNGIIFHEAVSRKVYAGGVVVFMGTLLVLFNGDFQLNYGDLLIVLATFFYPFGNIYGKRSVQIMPPWLVLMLRNLIAAAIILPVSFFFEYIPPNIVAITREHLGILLFNGIFVAMVSKWLWLRGLKDLSIVKATIFIICGAPIGILFSIFLAHEVPTYYQFFGSVLIVAGLWYLTMHEGRKKLEALAPNID